LRFGQHFPKFLGLNFFLNFAEQLRCGPDPLIDYLLICPRLIISNPLFVCLWLLRKPGRKNVNPLKSHLVFCCANCGKLQNNRICNVPYVPLKASCEVTLLRHPIAVSTELIKLRSGMAQAKPLTAATGTYDKRLM
jgi:hypothetical protein